jgi:hypothetical protein
MATSVSWCYSRDYTEHRPVLHRCLLAFGEIRMLVHERPDLIDKPCRVLARGGDDRVLAADQSDVDRPREMLHVGGLKDHASQRVLAVVIASAGQRPQVPVSCWPSAERDRARRRQLMICDLVLRCTAPAVVGLGEPVSPRTRLPTG